ncbi:MAG: glycosyltransferase family 2 protein [Candidatus Bathyarchaeia archaeon]
MNNSYRISVILPSRDEAETIGECIRRIRDVFNRHNINGEIIVSDNSNDGTPEIAKSLGAKVVTPDRLGYGYAYLYGFKHASGDILVLGDADGTYDFSEMPRLLEPILKGEADLVIGSRLKGKIEKGAMPWLHRYVGNPALTFLLNVFFKANVSDAHCGFRAIRKDALEKLNLKSYGMEFASEMILKASLMGLRIKEVPITYHPRKGGRSKLKSFRDGWRHLKFMLLFAPNYLYIYPGLSLFIFGFLLMLLSYSQVNVGYSPGLHSMVLGSFCLLVGFQITFFGFFAEAYMANVGLLKSGGVVRLILRHLSLERGIILGILFFSTGLAYLVGLLIRWMSSGYTAFPLRGEDIMAFTLLTLGLQIFFNSFLLSAFISFREPS